MHRIGLLGLLAASVAVGVVGDKIPLEEYRSWRAALRESLKDGVVILFGKTENEQADLRSGFFQEANFYYLTGWREPGAIVVLSPEGETLFIPRRDPEREKWTGRKAAPEDAGIEEVTGFERVLASETFEAQLPKLVEAAAKIYTLMDQPAGPKLQALLPLREFFDAAPAIAKLRMTKSAREQALIRRSVDITVEAHRAAWKRMAPGLFEYQIAATMSSVYFDAGCERHAYRPIVASGPNGAVLHYSRNSRRIDSGDLVVMDVGAECSAYAADITRTLPANGKFTRRQRELYEVVLGAQKAAIAAVKPGMTLGKSTPNSLYTIAYDYINSHGKDLHGDSLGKYFTHGVGHHVGLDVHDASDPAEPLAAGMVITIEPGIYLPEEGIGIRIEDTLLVTESGAQVLSKSLPKEVEDIEKARRR
jgi:Xaa-Pro aminopeptidase